MDKIELRKAFGQFTTGVCIVTSAIEGREPFAMTINSFSSLSLDPPLVLWSLQRDSELFEKWQMVTHFTVNILTQAQRSLSSLYSRKGEHILDADHYYLSSLQRPIIKDVLSYFECEISNRYDGGDHIILVGEVKNAKVYPKGNPLVFYSGQYNQLAEINKQK